MKRRNIIFMGIGLLLVGIIAIALFVVNQQDIPDTESTTSSEDSQKDSLKDSPNNANSEDLAKETESQDAESVTSEDQNTTTAQSEETNETEANGEEVVQTEATSEERCPNCRTNKY